MIMEMIRAFIIITIAEMGDKTQLLAMTFATKYNTKKVLIGVGIGSMLNHGLAILFGTILARYIDLNYLQILGGAMFLIFGLWGLRTDDGDEDEVKEKYGPVLTVALAFFIGELGDKTQLAAMTISTYANFATFVLAGTVLGMVFTSSIGIFVGVKIGDRVPEIYIKLLSSIIFLIFGFTKLYDSLPTEYLSLNYFGLGSVVIMGIALYMGQKMLKGRGLDSDYREVADQLRNQDIQLRLAVESLCLGGECDKCQGSSCAVGFIKEVLDSEEIDDKRIEFHKKKFSEAELIEAMSMTLYHYFKNRENGIENRKLELAKSAIEKTIFGKVVEVKEDFSDYMEHIKKLDSVSAIKVENRLKSMGMF